MRKLIALIVSYYRRFSDWDDRVVGRIPRKVQWMIGIPILVVAIIYAVNYGITNYENPVEELQVEVEGLK